MTGADTDTAALHLARFAALGGEAGGARARAMRRFEALGLPSQRIEAWHYTGLNALSKAALAPFDGTKIASSADDSMLAARLSAGPRLVFADGRLRAELSDLSGLPAGVRLLGLADARAREPSLVENRLDAEDEARAMRALNAAFAADGAVLVLPAGVRLDRPVQFIHFAAASGAAFHLRHLVVAGEGSAATVVETYFGAPRSASWTNAVTELELGRGATLRHVKWQDEAALAFHTASTHARLAGGARFESFVLHSGARLARNEIDATLADPGASCRLLGVTLAREKQHIDNTTVIDHAAPGCTSKEHYRGVLDGEARGVFQGRIVVRPQAQKTAAHQLIEHLLLSERAEASAKPELEIHADDVKCGHGATAGALDEQALFYLRARGIGLERARAMLVEGFVAALVDEVEDEGVRARLSSVVADWLAQAADERLAV